MNTDKSKIATIGIIISILFVVIIVAYLAFFRRTKLDQSQIVNQNSPTSTPYVAPPQIKILNALPSNEEKDVKLDRVITITIENSVPVEELDFVIVPDTQINRRQQGNVIYISPVTSWNPATEYSYVLKWPKQNLFTPSQRFSTEGGTPTPHELPPQDTVRINTEYNRVHLPDAYVYELLMNGPYSTDSFSMRAETNRDPNPKSDYYFVVTRKSGTSDEVKQRVKEWLLSKDLTEAQIENLDIRY